MDPIEQDLQDISDVAAARRMPVADGMRYLVERGWPEYDAWWAITNKPSAINIDERIPDEQ